MLKPGKPLLSVFVVGILITGHPVRAQSALDPIRGHAKLTSDDKQKIVARIQELVLSLRDAKGPDRVQVRDTMQNELTKGSPEFQSWAVGEAARELHDTIMGDRVDAALQGILALASLNNPATVDVLIEALGSRFAPVRYWAAKSFSDLRAQLKSPAVFQPVLRALAVQATREEDGLVLQQLYRAISIDEAVANFTGIVDEASALTRVFNSRALRPSRGGQFNFSDDIRGFQAALRIASKATQPPAPLVGSLARMLRAAVDVAKTDRSAISPDAVEECQAALQQFVRKFGNATIPKVADILRKNGADKELDAAIVAIMGDSSGRKGTLNGAPWNLKPGLPAE